MLRLRFAFFGEEQIDRTLDRFVKADDMRPAWRRLRERFVAYETETFGSEGHGSWQPLSPPYAAWKGRHFPGKTVMRREDTLFHSLTDNLDIDVEEPAFAIFGTSDPVGEYHQKGAGRLPQRKVIDLSETERQEWVRSVQEWLVSEGLG
jgi:phage gpG-like protein